MRYFNSHRRLLFKKQHERVIGTLNTANDENGVMIMPNTAGLGINSLEFLGNTEQKQYKGYNVYNAISYKSSTSYGVTVTCENNIFTVKGTSEIDATIIPIQIPIELLPNVTYTGRITKISGEYFPKSLSFYIYKKKPSLTWNAVFGSLSSASTNASVGKKAFTTEEIDSELVGGLCFAINAGQSVDYTVRLDIIEGDYTRDTMPEYEPYVGGVLSPNFDYPQAIKNAGDNGINIVVRGANLFDIDTVFGEMGGWTKQSDGSWYRFNVGQVYQKVLFTNTSQRQGKLTLLVNQRTATTDESKKGIAYAIFYTDGSKTALSPKVLDTFQYYTITTDENKTVDRIQFSYNYSFPTYIKEIMISWGDALEYEPYYELVIPVPNKITGRDEDGNEVEFEPKFIGMKHELTYSVSTVDSTRLIKEFENRDRMFIDNGRLFYEQNNAVFVITGNETLSQPTVEYGAPYMIDVYQNGGKPKRNVQYGDERDAHCQLIISNVCLSYYKLIAMLSKSGEMFPTINGVYPNIDMWGGPNEGVSNPTPEQCSTTIYIEIPGQNGLETANMLKAMCEAGHPVVVQYVCPTTTYDLTDTEFGQALLKLKTYYGKDMIMEIRSSPISVGGATVKYYSIEDEDKLVLTVQCQNEAGETLKASEEHKIRAGSKYSVRAPSIAGYIPIQSNIEGYIHENKEVIFIYKEDV